MNTLIFFNIWLKIACFFLKIRVELEGMRSCEAKGCPASPWVLGKFLWSKPEKDLGRLRVEKVVYTPGRVARQETANTLLRRK